MLKEVETDYVAGLTLGADPLVCGIAQKAYYSNKHIEIGRASCRERV